MLSHTETLKHVNIKNSFELLGEFILKSANLQMTENWTFLNFFFEKRYVMLLFSGFNVRNLSLTVFVLDTHQVF